MSKAELQKEWSGIGRAFLERAGFGDEPTNIRLLASCYGYHLEPVDELAMVGISGRVITYASTVSIERQRRHIAHELGHVALRRHGWPPRDEVAADYVAAVLLCPERPWKRDVRAMRWDLERLRAEYGVSWELAARRIADVRGAIVTIVDEGEISARLQSPWLHQPYTSTVEPFERAMIAEAALTREHVRRSDLCVAWHIEGEDGWRRVIVVVGVDEFDEHAMVGRGQVA
jgi:hypothetical protein